MAAGLTFRQPHPALRALATLHYVFRAGGQPFETLFGAMLPQLQWLVAGSGSVRVGDGAWVPLAPVTLCGPSLAAVRARGDGDFVLVGTGLRPAGWAALVGVPAAELASDLVDAGAVWGDATARLPGGVDPGDDAALVERADRALLARLHRARRPDPRIAAIDAWLATPERADIEGLARWLDLSFRQVERLVAASHGAAPRLLLARQRTLRAAARLALGDARGWQAAAEDVFADQPHFIRSFRRFVGVTPGLYLRGGSAALTRAAYAGRAAAGARDALALWS